MKLTQILKRHPGAGPNKMQKMAKLGTDSSATSFNAAYEKAVISEKKQIHQQMTQTGINFTSKKILQSYMGKQAKWEPRKLTPLRASRSKLKQKAHNHRYINVAHPQEQPDEGSDNRLAKIYIRSEKIREKPQNATPSKIQPKKLFLSKILALLNSMGGKA